MSMIGFSAPTGLTLGLAYPLARRLRSHGRLHRDRTSKNSVHELLISWMRARHFRYGALHDSGKKDGHLTDNLEVTRAALRPYGVNEWIPLTAGSILR
jgi:hypothetical protein